MNPSPLRCPVLPFSLLLLLLLLTLSACSSADPTTETVPPAQRDWLALAAEAESRTAWEEAAYDLDMAARYQSIDEHWMRRRLHAAENSGDLPKAVELRRQLLEKHPDESLLAIDLADDLQTLGEEDQALAALQPLVSAGDEAAREARAEVLRRADRPRAAAQAYERLATDLPGDDPRRAAFLQTASRLYERAGAYADALRVLKPTLDPSRRAAAEQQTLERLQAFQTGRPGNVADAVALLQAHPDPEFRLNALRYLARGEFPDQLLVLRKALADPDPRVRHAAMALYAARATPAEAPRLEHWLGDPDPELRLPAIRALGRVGSRAQIPLLLDALDPEDAVSFRAVRSALEDLSGQIYGVELDPGPARRKEIAAQWRSWWESRASGTDSSSPPASPERPQEKRP